MFESVKLFEEQDDIDTRLFLQLATKPTDDYSRLLDEFTPAINLYRFVSDHYRDLPCDKLYYSGVPSFKSVSMQLASVMTNATQTDAFQNAEKYFSKPMCKQIDSTMRLSLNCGTELCSHVIRNVREAVYRFS